MPEPRPVRAARGLLLAASLLAPAATLCAQNADSVTTLRAENVLTRVRRYTSSDVAMARQLADSLVSALPADASVMPEALFAKASIAASASDAERDYARIVNEHHFAARVPDALMRLALLENARNNRAGALRRLDQLLRDHGDAPVRSRASLLAGRLRMELNDPARGCELLAAAYASAGSNERDVREQAESLGARCPTAVAVMAEREPPPMGVKRAPREAVAATTPTAPAVQSAAARRRQRDSVLAVQRAQAAVATTARRDSAVLADVRRDSIRRDAARRDSVRRDAERTVAATTARREAERRDSLRRDSARAQASIAARRDSMRRDSLRAVVAAPPVTAPPVTPRRDTAVVAVAAPRTPPPAVPVARTVPPAPATPTMPASSAPTTGNYAVQFAAYSDRPGAEQFASVLQRRGIIARVEGDVKPFRVRAGRFTTRAEAEASAALWRRPGQAAIVVSYGPTP